MEKLDFLINYLLKENKEIKNYKLPTDIIEKKNLYRSLCNIREAKPISKKYIQIENEFLQEELEKKNVIKAEVLQPINKNNLQYNKICLWKGDITILKIDSIVNAANSAGLRLLCALS